MHSEDALHGVESVIITGELDRRQSRAPDFEAEAHALGSLAEAMSSDPGTVLQRLVDITMDLTHADSAGVSLLEPGGKGDSFRWVATAGAWAPYRDGVMPRDESPCGEVVARQAMLLMDAPERVFPALTQAQPGVGVGLLAPFTINGEPAGTLWAIMHDPDDRFDREDARVIQSLARFASVAHQTVLALAAARSSSRERAALLELALEATDTGAFTWDVAEDRGEADDRLGALFGLPPGPTSDLTTALATVIDPRDRDHYAASVAHAVDPAGDGRFGEEVRLSPVGGVERWVAMRGRVQFEGEPRRATRMIGTGSDITARKAAEAALRESDERFRQFSNASPNVLWIRNAATLRMEFASPAFDTVYGIPGPERGGDPSFRHWARLIDAEGRAAMIANMRRLRAGERIEQDFRIRRATDGAPRWIHNVDFPLCDSEGRVRWVAGVGKDVTAATEATERQGVLVAELQHRTRNLIAVVRSLADRTLGHAASLPEFQQRFRERLGALSRVQGLLSHLAAGERVSFDELLRSELDAHGAAEAMGARLTLDGPAGVPLRSGSVQTFALALHELATNAVKYGALAAADRHLDVRWWVEPGADGSWLHVEWRESGVVMPDAGAEPRGGGYGRELIERALPYQLQAETTYELGADGVRCTIAVPISRTAAGARCGG